MTVKLLKNAVSACYTGFHDISRGTPGFKLGLHEIHVGRRMLEEAVIAPAQIIESRFSVGGHGESIFRALAVAYVKEAAVHALPGQRLTLGKPEVGLTPAHNHLNKRLRLYVAQFIFRKYEVIAGVYVAVIFKHKSVAACLAERADAGLLPYPVGQSSVEQQTEYTDTLSP